jgi:hypothetical protein
MTAKRVHLIAFCKHEEHTMKQTIGFTQFVDAFRAYDRFEQFGYVALAALFVYCEEYEESCGIELELDVIALCCDWTAYESATAACADLAAAGEPVELTRTVYTAGWNMPGYMPDSEPVQFDYADDAREYIADNMADYADSIEDAADDDSMSAAELRTIAEHIREGYGELGITVAGWHYWITAETVANEDAEEQCLEWLQDQTSVIEFNGGILVMAF